MKQFGKSDGQTLSGAFCSRHLIAARALSGRDWERPKDILRARHLVREGATLADIMNALGWLVTRQQAMNRLRKYNIRPWGKVGRAHRGQNTALSTNSKTINIRNYRPRALVGSP
jgi:hypothetical protein